MVIPCRAVLRRPRSTCGPRGGTASGARRECLPPPSRVTCGVSGVCASRIDQSVVGTGGEQPDECEPGALSRVASSRPEWAAVQGSRGGWSRSARTVAPGRVTTRRGVSGLVGVMGVTRTRHRGECVGMTRAADNPSDRRVQRSRGVPALAGTVVRGPCGAFAIASVHGQDGRWGTAPHSSWPSGIPLGARPSSNDRPSGRSTKDAGCRTHTRRFRGDDIDPGCCWSPGQR